MVLQDYLEKQFHQYANHEKNQPNTIRDNSNLNCFVLRRDNSRKKSS